MKASTQYRTIRLLLVHVLVLRSVNLTLGLAMRFLFYVTYSARKTGGFSSYIIKCYFRYCSEMSEKYCNNGDNNEITIT